MEIRLNGEPHFSRTVTICPDCGRKVVTEGIRFGDLPVEDEELALAMHQDMDCPAWGARFRRWKWTAAYPYRWVRWKVMQARRWWTVDRHMTVEEKEERDRKRKENVEQIMQQMFGDDAGV